MYQNITILPIADERGIVERACILVYDMTDQAMSKLRVDKLNEQLKVISRVDGLTNLYNRRYWQERFEREFKLTFRNKKPMSVLMLDIDHFKAINDTYGHSTGDKVIKRVAELITELLPDDAIFGRIGGEEFAIVCNRASIEMVSNRMDIIRALVSQNHVIEENNTVVEFTISIGLSKFSSSMKNVDGLLHSADIALYEAKGTGRNKVIFRV